MKKHKKKILFPLIGILLLFCYFRFAYTDSISTEGFPVPREAHLFEYKQDKKEGFAIEKYKWTFAYEDRGITPFYEMTIWLWGWRKGEQMGASQDYTKGNKTVDLTTFNKEINVSKYQSK